MWCMDAWERLDGLLEREDVGVRLGVGSESMWSCELRVTPNPNVRGPVDLSLVLFSTGGESAEEALGACIQQLEDGRVLPALQAVRDAHDGLARWQ